MPPAVTTATEGDVYTSHVDARVQHFLETAKRTSVPIVTDKVTTHTYQPMYGMFLLIEASRQLRGDGGERQVAGAETGLVHGTGGTLSSGATVIL